MPDYLASDGGDTVVLLDDGCSEVVLGRVDASVEPLVLFETVARLHLAARRRGYSVCVVTDDSELIALFELVGLGQLIKSG